MSGATELIEEVVPGQSYVVVRDSHGMKAGDLLHLKSDKPWYWDDRRYLKKGELHKIVNIEENTLYLDRPVSDGYKVRQGETVKALSFPDQYFNLENLNIRHSHPSDTVMVKVNYASNSALTKVSIQNSQKIGIYLNKSYNTTISHANIILGTAMVVQTGYGIQDYGGSGTKITDSIFQQVRRGVDFSEDTPSRFGVVENSKAYGPMEGTLAEGNSGFGTHSTVEYITFRNNYIENFDQAFLPRGNHITINHNAAKNLKKTFVSIFYGDNLVLEKNTSSGQSGNQIESFILVPASYKGSISACDNKANNVRGPFLKGNMEQLMSVKLHRNRWSPKSG